MNVMRLDGINDMIGVRSWLY